MGFSSLPKALPPRQTRVHSYTPRTSRYLGPGRGETAANKKPQLVRAPQESGLRSQEPSSWVTMGTHGPVPAVQLCVAPGGRSQNGSARAVAPLTVLLSQSWIQPQTSKGPVGATQHPQTRQVSPIGHSFVPSERWPQIGLRLIVSSHTDPLQLDYNELARLQRHVNYTSRGKLRGAFTIIFRASGSS